MSERWIENIADPEQEGICGWCGAYLEDENRLLPDRGDHETMRAVSLLVDDDPIDFAILIQVVFFPERSLADIGEWLRRKTGKTFSKQAIHQRIKRHLQDQFPSLFPLLRRSSHNTIEATLAGRLGELEAEAQEV